MSKIHAQLRKVQNAYRGVHHSTADQSEVDVQNEQINLVISILQAMRQEHNCLYQTILAPISAYVCSQLPSTNRKSSPYMLLYEDFEKLSLNEIDCLCKWLVEKVGFFCTKLDFDPQEKQVI